MIKQGPKKLTIYQASDGRQPFVQWLNSLRDVATIARVRVRIDRVEEGNLGDYKALGTGLFELRLSFGSGYRVYFAIDGDDIVLLLSGGDKGSQKKDIVKARDYWTDYLMRKRK